MTGLQLVQELFEEHYQEEIKSTTAIPPSGSDRQYWIIKSAQHTALGAYNEDLSENRTFFYFSELFKRNNLNVPAIISKGNNNGAYLIEYIEGRSLLEIIQEQGHTDEVKDLLKRCLDDLIHFQWNAGKMIDYELCYGATAFNQEQIFADLQYFKYYFLDMHAVKYDKLILQEELQEMAKEIASYEPQTFMYRDFQSRNIIVQQGTNQPYYIDFQGGMKGIPQYDIASLLWQARAGLSAKWKNELLQYYYDTLIAQDDKIVINEIMFKKMYLSVVLLRLLQVLGAYGFRGIIQRKEHFVISIYPALLQLRAYLDDNPSTPDKPELRKVLEALTSDTIVNNYLPEHHNTDNQDKKLRIYIHSFAYKNGVAQDESSNGGGFVFDCRGILNPGRIDEYKSKTGRDASVAAYLAERTKMPTFLKSVWETIDISIQNYLERDFESLKISFGCTGGQHRSVYAAEQTAAYIQKKYSIVPELLHLEQEPNNKVRCKG